MESTNPAGLAAGVRWDLSDLYAAPDDPAIEADLDRALAQSQAFAERHRGGVATLAAADLAAAIDELEVLNEPTVRAACYSQLLFSADTSDPRHGALMQRVQERISEIRNTLLFFELEWVAVEAAAAEALLADPALARRRHFLDSMRRYRPHVLSEPEERILEETANTGRRAFSRLFDEIMSSMRFEVSTDGEIEDLGEEEVLSRLYSPDRDARRAASEALTAGLRANAGPLAFIFNTLVQDKAVDDRLRDYGAPMDARNLANEIADSSVDALLSACVENYPLVARYYRLKAKILGLDRLEDYDRYAPLPGSDRSVSFEDAKNLVLEAYADFCPEMADIARRFFDERWIDAELRPGKRGGAFSASTLPDVHPYVLLNYTGNQRDVMTVAHELGHGVHQTLAAAQGLFEQSTPLTTAETASVFGEMLVFRRLMKSESDPKARLALLCGKLEDAFATVFRQVCMTRFEESLHAARREEGELAMARIDELWLAANRPMFGDSVHLSDDYGCWWLYIPHFVHSPFYCYAYAFGELLVLALLRCYDEQGEAFAARYLDLLRAGGSDSPEALLARLDLDIDNPAFWRGGLALLEEMVDQAEELAA
ncbi:MAG: M3 family oligoendopeptidase [Deltaproteobacteria bacterium]|nr:M3 family oligoendopeptidase [Deltaproteobacteria bacterium]